MLSHIKENMVIMRVLGLTYQTEVNPILAMAGTIPFTFVALQVWFCEHQVKKFNSRSLKEKRKTQKGGWLNLHLLRLAMHQLLRTENATLLRDSVLLSYSDLVELGQGGYNCPSPGHSPQNRIVLLMGLYSLR